MTPNIIAVANQKGGVGKTTTSINLAQGLRLMDKKVLLIDLDPQGNATQGLGMSLEVIESSIADLIRNKEQDITEALYLSGNGPDLIPSNPLLSRVEREMVGMTNSEMRLSHRLKELNGKYDFIIIDTPPTFGPLMNSALNAAEYLIVPVDCGYFAMTGIKEILSEIKDIHLGTNPNLKVLGYLLTLVDRTRISNEVLDSLVTNFGDEVFESKIRRSVKLKEAPTLGKSIFDYAKNSTAAEDYWRLAHEVIERLDAKAIRNFQATETIAVAGGVR